jgi:hypothetical protein
MNLTITDAGNGESFYQGTLAHGESFYQGTLTHGLDISIFF